jgi:hypothetical protein
MNVGGRMHLARSLNAKNIIDTPLRLMDIKNKEVCRTANNAFGKYCIMLFTSWFYFCPLTSKISSRVKGG